MRVELSPWKLTETTLSHHLDGSDNLSIKRRKDRLTSWSREEKNFAACFIEQTSSSLRSRKKRIVKKGQSSKSITSEDEDRLPVLICTSPHRISVLVENDTSDNDTGSNQENPVPVLQESYMLQFSSRPSKGNAYLPPHNVPPSTNVQKNGKSQSSSRDFVHAIPAVYDSMRNVVFALQEGNTKLVCINASGSDQRVPNEVSLSLDYPACSLSILHIPRTKLNHSVRSFAYGSCIDGRFFVASLYMPMERELKATLKVEYIVSLDPLSASNDRSMAKHLATCATLVTNGSMVSSREGRSPKRKEVDSNFECDDSTHVLMYQIFLHGNSIWVAKCHISVATPFNYGDSIENGGTSWVNCVADNNSRCSNSVSVVHLTDSTPGKTTISDVSVLGLVEGSEVVSIFYRKSDDHNLTEKNRLPYYASISLLTFTMIDCPVPLPDDTQQIGLVGPALLAVLTSKHDVYLFDSIRKGHVYFRRKIEPIPNDSSDCLLLTDSKRSRLAVAFMRGSKFTVAFASAHATNEASMQLLLRGPRLSLAAGIASSRTLPIAPVVPRTFRLDKNLTDLEDDSDKSQVVAEGIRRLADAYRKVSAGAAEAFVPSYLLDEYGATLQMVQGFSTLPATRKYRDNPQGVVHSKNGSKFNGFHSAASTKGKMENGSHAGLLTCLRAVPQQFLDFALSGAISTLCCNKNVIAPNTGVRNDARVILRQLVRTGRLSARCFMVPEQQLSFTEVLNALKVDPRESTTLSAYTPFELADDILSFCTDASERQMIGIFHFMTSRAAPEDVASFFARKSRKGERRCIISKCTRFLCLNKTPRPTPSESEELSRLTQKIVAFGLVRSTQQIVRYAKCNASLLRDAIDRLLSRDEIRFLANCLLDMLTEPTKFFYLANATERCNVLKYLTVIFDHSVDSFSENEPTEYVRMKKVIAALVAETTNVLSLQTALHESVEFVETTRPNRILVTNVVHDKTAPASLPPYQIERLVF